jgi:hypothetical protein
LNELFVTKAMKMHSTVKYQVALLHWSRVNTIGATTLFLKKDAIIRF